MFSSELSASISENSNSSFHGIKPLC